MHIEQLRTLCLEMPAATEALKWDADLVFSVGGKMFCIANTEGPLRFSVKVGLEALADYTSRSAFVPAPYLARAGWIQVVEPLQLSSTEISALIKQSHALVTRTLTKKMRLELNLL